MNPIEIRIDNDSKKIYFKGEEYEIGTLLLSFVKEVSSADGSGKHPYIKHFGQSKTTLAKARKLYDENIVKCLGIGLEESRKTKELFRKNNEPVPRFYRWQHSKSYNHSLDKPVPMQYQAVKEAKDSYRLYETYIVTDLLELCYVEFIKMVQLGMNVRECQNCHSYFVPKREGDVKYCRRKPDGGNRTCQQIGARAEFQAKDTENPLRLQYLKIYNRYYGRYRSGSDDIKITPEHFAEWKEQAKEIRDKALAEDWTVEQLRTELKMALETIQSI